MLLIIRFGLDNPEDSTMKQVFAGENQLSGEALAIRATESRANHVTDEGQFFIGLALELAPQGHDKSPHPERLVLARR